MIPHSHDIVDRGVPASGMDTPLSDTGTAALFDAIAPRYDLLNRLLSAGIDRVWRRRAVRLLGPVDGLVCLDAAAGTGELSLVLARKGAEVTGIDISEGMLALARRKAARGRSYSDTRFLVQSCESLRFPDGPFDAAVIGFGIRNMKSPEKALSELFRVLKPGGTLVVLEFSRPRNRFVRAIFDVYFMRILPAIGKAVSGHPFAYSYLPESVRNFPCGEAFLGLMRDAGFAGAECRSLTLGIAAVYRGTKP